MAKFQSRMLLSQLDIDWRTQVRPPRDAFFTITKSLSQELMMSIVVIACIEIVHLVYYLLAFSLLSK